MVAALRRQLHAWREALDEGADRVGWKIGLNIPEVQQTLGIEEPVIGHLTSRTVIEPGGEYDAAAASRLVAEAEVAVQVGRDEAIAGLAPAIELVDVGSPRQDLEQIVAGNVFHRGVVLGPTLPAFPAEGVRAVLAVDGEERAAADAPDDFSDVVRVAAGLLGAVGERLLPGDRIIAGSVASAPVEPGSVVRVDFGRLGKLEVTVT